LLKMAHELGTKVPFKDRPQRFQADVLVVDEASMMVFPHFLALSSLVLPTGEIMLAGDNRQLAPIVAHDWENEDRPPAQYYQPFKSAYEAVLRIIDENAPAPAMARQSALTYTFRLPPIIRELIARLYRSLDAIELAGTDRFAFPAVGQGGAETWGRVWEEQNGLVLVVHSERSSRQSNALEGQIIGRILAAGGHLADDSVAIITPHRAQRAMLRGVLEPYASAASVIDTVERLQGGERPVIIVSGTESDPHAIGAAASFILNLNRSNVAFSRTQERLIVVCAETLLDHIPAELEDYESAMLWKSLRALCSRPLLVTEIEGVRVRVLAPAVRDAGRS
jgi:superfamily I DNA and/or RNA helicase